MQKEILRQLVHLSGLLFVILAQLLDKWLSATMFFLIGLYFLFYWEYTKIQKRPIIGLRKLALFLERKNTRPFTGAMFFYVGCGIAFVLFPHNIASTASAILAVGDSASTIIGVKFGRHKIFRKKSVEGSLAFFLYSLAISLFFVKWNIGFFGALAGTIIELIVPPKIGKKTYWILDDNLLIPLISGAAIWLITLL